MATKFKATNLRRVFVKEWLAELNISQAELARLMETDKANVTRWLGEPWRITMDVLSAIADALVPYAAEMRDAGNLLRPPADARSIEVARRAAERFLGDLPPGPTPVQPGARRKA